MTDGLSSLYRAIGTGDADAIRPHLRNDIFAMGSSASAVFTTVEAAAADLASWSHAALAESHVTIGSVDGEVFLGPAAKRAWTDFVTHVTFQLRGGVRGALITPDAARLATNIGVGTPPTPYRFFYVWALEDDGWRIALSHDAVSRELS